MFYRETYRAPQAGRMAPLSSFPEATLHISDQVTHLGAPVLHLYILILYTD